VSEAKVDVLAVGIRPMRDESGQVVEDPGQIYLCLHQSPVNNILPDLLDMRADGIQRTCQAIIVELLGRLPQQGNEHGLGQPLRHLIERPGSRQAAEDQHHRHRAMRYLGGRRTVTIDALAHL
jgi:hypothetical protein